MKNLKNRNDDGTKPNIPKATFQQCLLRIYIIKAGGVPFNNRKEIIPLARKGIHYGCELCSSKRLGGMGKYGLRNKTCGRVTNLSYQQNTSQEDVDEVDNVQSKHVKPSISKTNLDTGRKKSVDSINNIYSDESDDENTTQEFLTPERARNNSSNISNPRILSPLNLQVNSNSLPEPPDNNGFQWNQILIVTVIAIIMGGIYFNGDIFKSIFSKNIYNNINIIIHHNNIYDERKFAKDVISLGEKYNVTDDSMLQIRSGISTIFDRQDTGCFIFAYNSGNINFSTAHFQEFMHDISSTAARYLRNESDIRGHVIVDSTKLNMREHGELIRRYKDDVTKTGVMFVKDVDEVSPELAMAFHYYCDEFNPLIKKSAIFFTLDMARCSDQKTTYASIEKCLLTKWTTVSKDKIRPLLSRVVSIIVNVTSVF